MSHISSGQIPCGKAINAHTASSPKLETNTDQCRNSGRTKTSPLWSDATSRSTPRRTRLTPHVGRALNLTSGLLVRRLLSSSILLFQFFFLHSPPTRLAVLCRVNFSKSNRFPRVSGEGSAVL